MSPLRLHRYFEGLLWVLASLLLNPLSLSEVFAETSPQRYAVLVGCTQYPNLPEERWLQGGENDVELIARVLTGKLFQFPPGHIVKLAGWPNNQAQRPTRENIRYAFQHLADIARPGDQMVIFLSGHGSQQPDRDSDEADGLDEIFLPADVGQWEGKRGPVKNSIVDDELKEWVMAIRDKGGFVWLIVDACHSGTLVRGAPIEAQRERLLPADMLIPHDILQEVRGASAPEKQTKDTNRDKHILGLSSSAANIIAMFATQPDSFTFEATLPEENDPVYGIFTYTLVNILLESAHPLTYRELAERIQSCYQGRVRYQLTPMIEGGALDREVLGLREWPARPKILLEHSRKTGILQLRAGNLHGLNSGTVLAVYPPAGKGEQLIGHVEVTDTAPFSSHVQPIAFEDSAAPEKEHLVSGSRCKVVFVDYGDVHVKIALQHAIDEDKKSAFRKEKPIRTLAPGEGAAILESALEELAGDKQAHRLIKRVSNAAEAEWFMRVIGDQIHFIPASGVPEADKDLPQFSLGSTTQHPEQLATRLSAILIRIAKINNLLKIAHESKTATRSPGAIDVTVELLRFKNEDAQEGDVVPYGTNGRILHPGDVIAFRLENLTEHKLDVSVLFIDSGYGIKAFFPDPDYFDDNRLPPGHTLITPKARVKDETLGFEQIVVIAVKAGNDRIDFSCLEQPTLEIAWDAERGYRAMDSALGQVLETFLYGEGSTRGMAYTDLNDYVVRVLGWRTVPAGE